MIKFYFFLTFLTVSYCSIINNDLKYEILEEDVLDREWNKFKNIFGKNYNKEEDNLRKKIFIENRKYIFEHNDKMAENGPNSPSFFLGINKYSDLSLNEIVSTMNGYRRDLKKYNGSTHLTAHNVNIPEELDWRTKGYVTEVKDQGQCGSCWAFSATGSLEGQTYRKIKKHVNLSEQNLIDCSKSYGNNGCNGGLMDNAFEYIKKNHGIDSEKSYPYEAKNMKCRYKKNKKVADDNGFVHVKSQNEDTLLEALATIGPISIAIDASHRSFLLYSHGIYDEPKCSSTNLDHGVLLVGYGQDKNTDVKYWIIKNSWGTTWGEKGYIKFVRGKNLCGIATAASYPLV